MARYKMPLLAHFNQATGLRVRRPQAVSYEKAVLGEIPDKGGWRANGRGSAQDRQAGAARDRATRGGATASRGYEILHHAVDDHSRLVSSEILNDEKKETAAGFWLRAKVYFADAGISSGLVARAIKPGFFAHS